MAESSTITREPPVSSTPVPILYVNHRGETSVRRIVPGPLWFGSTEWHPEPQWLMTADEPDTGKRRDFALAGIKAWSDAAVDAALAATTAPTDREALRKALTEITDAADKMILSLPGHWHDDATIELTDAVGDARAALSAAAQNDLYDVSSDAAPTGSGNTSEAARDVIAENADCRRPAVACGAGGTGTGGCGCMLAADAVLRLAAPATEAARG